MLYVILAANLKACSLINLILKYARGLACKEYQEWLIPLEFRAQRLGMQGVSRVAYTLRVPSPEAWHARSIKSGLYP